MIAAIAFIRSPLGMVAGAAMLCLASFSFGVVKGWNASNADHWRKQAEAFESAAKQKEQIAEADRARAEAADAELARMEATLESVIHEAKKSPNPTMFAPGELDGLRQLASGRSGRRS